MKTQIISDIHVEHYKGISKFIPSKEAEVIIFAGDIVGNPNQAKEFFTNLRKQTEATFLYVLGNHEFLGNIFSETDKKYKDAVKDIPNMHFLNKKTYIQDNTTFIGCTMWTDYDKQRGLRSAIYGMIDFELILENERQLLNPNTILNENKKSIKFIKKSLISKTTEKAIVITHHMPSFSMIQPQYKNSSLNGSFAMDLDNFILDLQPNYWVCGHTHSFIDTWIDKTHIICNQIGYPREKLPLKEIVIDL
jgi:Icc-related predicted phosphoesterase